MKKLLVILLVVVLLFALCACNDTPPEANPPNGVGGAEKPDDKPSDTPTETPSNGILVAYFSCTGTTEKVAEYVAEAVKGTLHRIEPKVPYTEADLQYYTDCRADREQDDASARPEISGGVENMSQYNTVFIGYPIWHGQAPKIIYTFLESYDFSGKTVVPFCTSASSGMGSSATNLHKLAPKANWQEGRRFGSSATGSDIENWVKSLNIAQEVLTVKIYCGNNVLQMTLEDNPSAKAFVEKLRQGDVTVTMDDYGNFEKVGELGFSLPQINRQITTRPGDVILYLGTNVTIYYDQNSWNFTLLGHIPDMTRESMLTFFGGKGQVTVRFSLK